MKRLLCAVLLLCAYASAQQINPAQIQPGTNGQQLCTVGGVAGWANCDSGSTLPSGTTNQMLYYAAPGTAVTPLTLGTNLSITGSTLNAAGGGGGSPAGSNGNPQINASGSFGAVGQVFFQQSGDTIASIETQCSSLCTYVVTEPQTITLSGDHAMSSNVWVRFEGDGAWNVTGAHTLSNVQVASGTTLTQHFSLAGSAVVILSVLNTQNPVLWFGAKCDGSTNDLTAIQNTINATTYGQAVLPAAVCNIAGTLTVNKNSVGIRGAQAGRGGGQASLGAFVSSLVETVAGDSAITETGVSGTPIVYNIYQDFNILSSVTQTGTAAGLSLSFTGGVKVENLFSQDFFYPYYIHASPSYSTGGFIHAIFGWTSLSSGMTAPVGFYLDSADGNAEDSLTIRDSSGNQGGGPASCIGMMLYGTAVNDVNTFNFNVAGCNDGQDVNYTGTGAIATAGDIHFISTTVDQFHRYAFYFTATSTLDSQAANNSITVLDPRVSTSGGAATYGVYALNTSGVIVSGGQFLNYGIYASGSTQLTLTGNTLQDAQASPIALTSSTYSSISSNTVTNSSSFGGTFGIVLNGSSSYDNVTSNNVTGYFSQADIYTDTGTANNTVVGNQVDPTHATLASIGLNGAGTIAFNSSPNSFRSSIDTTGDSTTDLPGYRGIGPVNFSGWKDGTPTGAWAMGYAVPGATAGCNPLFAYYDGTNWHESWDVDCSTGVLNAINGITVTGGTPGVATPVLSINGTTFTASGCSNTTLVGGATAGSFDSGTTGTCTVTVTMGNSVTAAHGFYCGANDITTPADVIHQTAFTTTTATLSGTTVSGDVLNFSCTGY